MRSYYISPPTPNNTGARGGIYSCYDDGEYDLEIGNSLNSCHKMLAVCVCIDEINEFLNFASGLEYPVGQLANHVLDTLKEVRDKMDAEYEKKDRANTQ